MQTIYLSYLDLTPGLENKFVDSTHNTIIDILRKYFRNWKGFFARYPEYSISFIVTTKRDVHQLEVKGPTVYKKNKAVDFVIFLPNNKYDIVKYVDYVFQGIQISLNNYDVSNKEIDEMHAECKRMFN